MGICDPSGLVLSLAFVRGRVSVSGYCVDLSRTARRRIVLGAMIWLEKRAFSWSVRTKYHPAFYN